MHRSGHPVRRFLSYSHSVTPPGFVMKKFPVVAAFALSLLGAGHLAMADDAATDAVRDKIAKAIGVSRDDVRPSPVAGLFEVRHDHDFGYVSADGKYLLQG